MSTDDHKNESNATEEEHAIEHKIQFECAAFLDSVPVGVPQMAGAEELSPLVRKIRKKPP